MRRFAFVVVLSACSADDTTTPVPDASLPDTSVLDAGHLPDGADAFVDAGPDEVVWAHTATELYRFAPGTHALSVVGTFSCAADQVFNIAVDASERIYGVTSQGLVAIDPKTAACFPIAAGVYPHSLAFVPKGIFDPDGEALVGYRFPQYVRIDETTGVQTPMGAMNPNGLGLQFSVSGDLFATAGGRLFVTVTNGPSGDRVVEADPKTGRVIQIVGDTTVLDLLGFAQWDGIGYAFSAQGRAYAVDLHDAGLVQVYPALDAGDAAALSFTGAGVTTRAPTNDL